MLEHMPSSENNTHKHAHRYVECPSCTSVIDVGHVDVSVNRSTNITPMTPINTTLSIIERDNLQKLNKGLVHHITPLGAVNCDDIENDSTADVCIVADAIESSDESNNINDQNPQKELSNNDADKDAKESTVDGLCLVSIPTSKDDVPDAVRKLENEKNAIRRRSSMQVREYATMVTLAALYSLFA